MQQFSCRQKRIQLIIYLLAFLGIVSPCAFSDQEVIKNYNRAKTIFWRELYPGDGQELYCGRRYTSKEDNMSIEHAFPADWMKQNVGCRTRVLCRKTNEKFNHAEADLHNLLPADLTLNQVRNNNLFRNLPGEPREFGPTCDFEIDRPNKAVEPRPAVQGDLARAIFYMRDEYGFTFDRVKRIDQLEISEDDWQRFMEQLKVWHKADPPSHEEIVRNAEIERLQGTRNPYIDDPSLMPSP
jgi:deoxyribonuclease-1